MPDILFRIFLKLGYAASLVFCFVFRPATNSVIIAIWSEKKLLIIKNSYYPKFGIPGGYVKIGENPKKAAVREIFEEVGIVAVPNHLKSMGKVKGISGFKKETTYCYELRPANTPVIVLDNREVVWFDFLSLEQALQLNLTPPVKLFLNKYRVDRA